MAITEETHAYKMGRVDERLAVIRDMGELSQDRAAMKNANALFLALLHRIDSRAAVPAPCQDYGECPGSGTGCPDCGGPDKGEE